MSNKTVLHEVCDHPENLFLSFPCTRAGSPTTNELLVAQRGPGDLVGEIALLTKSLARGEWNKL